MDQSSPPLKALQESADRTVYAYDSPQPNLLEWFENPHRRLRRSGDLTVALHTELVVAISVPEFTCLCPKTGQPDFAEIVVNYTPDERCVESKSLKLYMGSFRNTGIFHEACVVKMLEDLVGVLSPNFIEIVGKFAPRGGIPFHPRATYYKAS